MNLNKAIALNEEAEKSLKKAKFIEHSNAILIGKFAIERILLMRSYNIEMSIGKLPGETSDVTKE